MKEKDIQRAFGKYLQSPENIFKNKTVTFELKIINVEKKDSIKIRSTNPKNLTVKRHQIVGLVDSMIGLYHKISDSPIYQGNRSRFTAPKPFDCMYICAEQAYIGIAFYYPRKYNTLYLVPVTIFESVNHLYYTSKGKKSMNYDEFIKFYCGNIEKGDIKVIDLKHWSKNT